MIRWQLEMFGELRLLRDGQEAVRLRTRKTEALLAYLVLFPQSHTREHLAGLFWETSGPQEARNSLSVALHALRSALESTTQPTLPMVLTDSTTVRLDVSQLFSDVARFERALQNADVAGEDDQRLTCLQEALACCRGPLLPALYEDWVAAERGRLEARLQEALRQSVHLLAKRQEYLPALEYALRAADLDPLNEANCRDIMRLQIALGNPHSALAQYRALAQRLQEEVRLTPSAATVALAQQITREASGGTSGSAAPMSQTGALDRFFGREAELAMVKAWLEEGTEDAECATLITLTGIGGVGKTRLAREAARHSVALFGRKIHFFNLAEEADTDCLLETLCRDLRLPRRVEIDPLEQLAGVVGALPVLLILDNFEQIVEGGSQQVQRLRERLPNLALLITSRRRLNIAGEQECVLYPFPTPVLPASETIADLEILNCVQLFVARCRQHQAGFALTPDNAATIAQICVRLDGLPLALELAAAWMRVLSPQQLLKRLEQRFDLLVSARRDLPPRHRSLRAAIEGSYRLLEPEAQRFFTGLAVFAGGWDLEMAQAVCGGDALGMLAALQDASLLVTERNTEGAPRFRLVETLREFAAEQGTPEERAETERRYIAALLALAEQGNLELNGRNVRPWYGRLEAEHDNFRAALALCFAPNSAVTSTSPPALESGIRLTIALMKFWHLRGYQSEWERWQRAAYAASEEVSPELRAALYMEILAGYPGVVGPQFAAKSLALGEALHDVPLIAHTKLWMAEGYRLERFDYALQLTEQAQSLLQSANCPDLLGYAWNRYAVLQCRKERGQGQAAFLKAVAVLRQAQAPYLLTMSLFDAAFYAAGPGAEERAEALLEEGIAICGALDHHGGRAHGLWILGKYVRGHDLERAEACFQESLELHQHYGFPDSKSLPLFELGYTALLQGEYRRAREFFQAACAARPAMEQEGIYYPLMWCALGMEEEAAFRFYETEHLRLMADADAAQQEVGALRMFTAVRAENFATARACYTELKSLWQRNPSLIPPDVFFLAAARWMAAEGEWSVAARLLGIETYPEEDRRRLRFPLETHLLEQSEDLLRAALSEAELAAARAEGSAMEADARRTLRLTLPTAPRHSNASPNAAQG